MRRHPRLQQVLSVLLRLWDAFELPPNPLDHLTELLGGPDQVRERRPQRTVPASCILAARAPRPHISLCLMCRALMHGPVRET